MRSLALLVMWVLTTALMAVEPAAWIAEAQAAGVERLPFARAAIGDAGSEIMVARLMAAADTGDQRLAVLADPALNSQEEMVVLAGIALLRRVGCVGNSQVEALVTLLGRAHSSAIKVEICKLIADCPIGAASPVLVTALYDPDEQVALGARLAAETLCREIGLGRDQLAEHLAARRTGDLQRVAIAAAQLATPGEGPERLGAIRSLSEIRAARDEAVDLIAPLRLSPSPEIAFLARLTIENLDCPARRILAGEDQSAGLVTSTPSARERLTAHPLSSVESVAPTLATAPVAAMTSAPGVSAPGESHGLLAVITTLIGLLGLAQVVVTMKRSVVLPATSLKEAANSTRIIRRRQRMTWLQ